MELPYLVEQGVLPCRKDRGVLRIMPAHIQHTVAEAIITHVHEVLHSYVSLLCSPHVSVSIHLMLKRIAETESCKVRFLRSEQDVQYLIETIGVALSFPCTDSRVILISKAIDIFGVLMSASFQDTLLAHISQERKETFTIDMLEFFTLLMARCSDQDTSLRHADLLGKYVDVASRALESHQSRMSQKGWEHLVTMTMGLVRYLTHIPNAHIPSGPVRSSFASLVIEVMIRANLKTADVWQVMSDAEPNSLEIITQWNRAIIALTRAVSLIIMNKPSPSHITICWSGVQAHVRQKSTFSHLDGSSVCFMWKRLIELLYQQSIVGDDAKIVFVGALRDISLLLSCASYWGNLQTPLIYEFNTSQKPVSKISPIGPSSAALTKLCADRLVVSLSGVDMLRIRAIQGLCFILLRRETVSELPNSYLSQLFHNISLLGEDPSIAVRSELVLHMAPLFLVNIPIPLLTLEAIATAACAFAGGLFDSANQDTDDEDDTEMLAGTRTKVWSVVALVNTYLHIQVLGMPSVRPRSIFLALVSGLESQISNSVVVQRLCCAAVMLFHGESRSLHHRADVMHSLISIIKASYNTYELQTVLTAMMCLSWMPLLIKDIAIHVLEALCHVCVASRQVMEQCDLGIEDTSSVYCEAIRAMCTIMSQSPALGFSLCASADSSQYLFKSINAGLKESLLPNTRIREAARTLLGIYQLSVLIPVVKGETVTSHPETESDYAATATCIKCFAVGTSRLISLIQTDSGSVVVIVRSTIGKHVWVLHDIPLNNNNMQASSDTESYAAIRALLGDQNKAFTTPVPPFSDALKSVRELAHTKEFIKDLEKNPIIRNVIEEMSVGAQKTKQFYFIEPTPLPIVDWCAPVVDDVGYRYKNAKSVAANILQLQSVAVRELPFDAKLIRMLKGIDLLPTRELVDIPVLCVLDDMADGAPRGFWMLCDSLGWRRPEEMSIPPTEITSVVYEDNWRCIRFYPSVVTTEEIEENLDEVDDGVEVEGISALVSVRVIWDATRNGYDWASIDHAGHDAFRELYPQHTRSRNKSNVDFILRPLVDVGLFSIRLQLPEPLSMIKEEPLRWGAPLLHGSTLPSLILPYLLREAVYNVVYQRLIESNRYRSPVLVRQAALWSVMEKHPVMLPSQFLAVFSD